MKRALLLICVLYLCATTSVKAQNVAIGLHTGIGLYAGNGTGLGIPVGMNAEWAYNAVHSFSGRLHYSIGPRSQDLGFVYISPEYKYYLTGEALNGFYAGGFMGFGGGNGSGYFSLGGVTGYSTTIGKQLNLETNVQFGWGNFTKLKTNVFHFVPSIGLRYSF